MPSSGGSSQSRDQTQVFRIADDLWILWCLSHQGSPCVCMYTHTHTCMVVYLALLGLRCCTGFSLAEVSRDPSLVVVHRLPFAAAAFVVESGLSSIQAPERGLSSWGTQA